MSHSASVAELLITSSVFARGIVLVLTMCAIGLVATWVMHAYLAYQTAGAFSERLAAARDVRLALLRQQHAGLDEPRLEPHLPGDDTHVKRLPRSRPRLPPISRRGRPTPSRVLPLRQRERP
jgi:hypothetical protein